MIEYKDFFESAEKLLKEGGEMAMRNSISRAYYGFYHIALKYADSVAVPAISDLRGPSHKKLSTFYEGGVHSDAELRRKMRGIGYSLKQCHEVRCRADYLINEHVTELEAQAQLKACAAKASVLIELQP